jgi:hypothetical protein
MVFGSLNLIDVGALIDREIFRRRDGRRRGRQVDDKRPGPTEFWRLRHRREEILDAQVPQIPIGRRVDRRCHESLLSVNVPQS